MVVAADDFETFFREVYPTALRVAVRLVQDLHQAEDISAEAFARALTRWRRVSPLPHREAWVLRVTTNLAIDHLRRHRPVEQLLADSDDAAFEGVLDRMVLTSIIRRLPRRQREVLVMRHYAGLSEADVAAALGIAPSSVKTHLARALSNTNIADGVHP